MTGTQLNSIESVLKNFKANESNREGLHVYYNRAVEAFQGTIRDFSKDLAINVTTPDLDDNDVQELALNIMKIQQLDVFDAKTYQPSTKLGW